jgi:hypothetical protein
LPRPWSEIKEFYQEFVEAGHRLEGMVHLVEQIEASRYATGLFALTSMHDLCITQVPSFSMRFDEPYLRVSPHFDGTVTFRYVDTHIENKQWHRVVKDEEAFSRLERFIDQLHWFPKERRMRP